MDIALGERESQIMEVLWDHGSLTVAEVSSLLKVKRAYTTNLTMLRKLEEKGYVGHTEEGRAHAYHATVDRADARQCAIQALVSRLFKGSSTALVTHVLGREKMTMGDARRIRVLLRRATQM
jgi:predicted transcriptional regulator